MHNTDVLYPFIFDNTAVRGNLVKLNKTFQDVLQHQNLPHLIEIALGELMAASTLLATTLKMDGALVLQIQSKSALKLLVVECRSDLTMRATAKWDGEIPKKAAFFDLVKNGQCVITLDPKHGKSYQGIVPIEGKSIANMLENYMLMSQQLDTKLWLHCDGDSAVGMLLQKLPETPALQEKDTDAWNRINMLANTLTNKELQTLAVAPLLTRLFSEEDIRLFDARPTQFHCNCNRESVGSMLQMLGQNEVDKILAEQTNIEVNCDFCNMHYQFDAVDAAILFNAEASKDSGKLVH